MNKILVPMAFIAATLAAPAAAQQVNVDYNGTVVLSNGGAVSPLTEGVDLSGTAAAADVFDGNNTFTLNNVTIATADFGSETFAALTGVFTNNITGTSVNLFDGTDLLVSFGNIHYGPVPGQDAITGTADITTGAQHLIFKGQLVGIQGGTGTISASVTAVPEPATWAMMLIGFGGMGFAMRRKRNPALTQIA